MKIFALHFAGASLLLMTMSVWGQIVDTPGVKFGPPKAERFMGEVPANMRPPSSDPRDLNGVYVPQLNFGDGVPSAPADGEPAAAPAQKASADDGGFPARGAEFVNPQMQCVPDAQIGSSPYTGKIIQTPGRITFIVEYNHLVRRVYLDRGFPDKIKPSYSGYSIGRWEGDTLIIETRGLKTARLANSPDMAAIERVLERVRKLDGGRIVEDVATVEGIDRTGKPITSTVRANVLWRPDIKLQEFICEEGAGRFFTQGDAG